MLVSTAFAALASLAVSVSAVPTLYLVGDSTMASHAASEGIEGWGVIVHSFLTGITVVNDAVSGRSARSYAREGRFYNIVQSLKAGDFVLIEFGHNDGGSPDTSDRASVVGETLTLTETVTLANGTVEVVHVWPSYVQGMISQVVAKGATPIVSSQTPNNPYENSSTIVNSPPRFVPYAKNAAAAKGVPYVDHFAACISAYSEKSAATVDAYFPIDHTHTNTNGATAVAQAFISGMKCSAAKSALTPYFNAAGVALPSRC